MAFQSLSGVGLPSRSQQTGRPAAASTAWGRTGGRTDSFFSSPLNRPLTSSSAPRYLRLVRAGSAAYSAASRAAVTRTTAVPVGLKTGSGAVGPAGFSGALAGGGGAGAGAGFAAAFF